MTPRRLGVLALIAATAAALAAAVVLAVDRPASRPGDASQALGGEGATGFAGAGVPALPARDFALADQSGRPVSLASVRGHVTVLAFLSSTCGATCTLIAQQVRGALDELTHPVPVLLISVDPSGDTPASVARFLARVSLAGRARFLTGTRAALEAAWREYGVQPLITGRSAFERGATVRLLNRDGRE